ncbi:MAG: hypothetical protein KDC80_19095 [Saprospiraceae bacterium]|nr:hypothetical protein [Saprospiraceae bacterium]
MKKIVLLSLLFMTPATAYLQWEMSSIYRDASGYFQAILDQDVEKIMTYLHPAFTDSPESEEIIAEYFYTLGDPESGIQFKDISFQSASDIVKHKNLSYRAVFFRFTLLVNLDDEDADPDLWLEMLGQQYGEKNVKHHVDKGQITVNGVDGMYAFKNSENETWKFINAQALYLMEDIIPEVVLNAFAVPLAEWRVSNL